MRSVGFQENIEMETFRRSVAYVVLFLAVLFGGASLMAFFIESNIKQNMKQLRS